MNPNLVPAQPASQSRQPRTWPEELAKRLKLSLGQAPDSARHNPDPDYIRTLVRWSGLTQDEVAARLGLDVRTLRRYQSTNSKTICRAPYSVQFALEMLFARRARSIGVARTRRSK